MNDRQKECIFTWFIENYSYSWHENGQPLVSPEFTAEGLDGTIWSLELFPRGYDYDCIGKISLFVRRNEEDDGPDKISVTCTLSFLQSDGADLESETWECVFRNGIGDGWLNFLKREEVHSIRNAEYLPHDTLTVRCRIKRDNGKGQKRTQIFARTRISLEQVSFLHTVESFSTIEPNQKKTIQIRTSKKEFSLSSSLHFTDGSCCEEKIIMEMTPFGANQILTNCDISLIDGSGKFIQCGAADNRFGDARTDISKITLSLTKQAIMDKKSEYLPDDKLTLLCKCIFSARLESEIIDGTLGNTALNKVNKNDQNKDIYNTTAQVFAGPSATDDLKVVYDDQLLTDVELKTKTKSFSAHKIVLCARSSVFKAMLTNDMKEKNTNSIQVDDLENDTVQQLLLFLYSDSIENLQWESAIQLYYAADKYEIEKLKVVCSSFLVDNLNTSNASELLLLADTHNDCDLKKVVEHFIFKHEDEVFGSDEWGNLMETNPLLVSKTMRLKYMKKL